MAVAIRLGRISTESAPNTLSNASPTQQSSSEEKLTGDVDDANFSDEPSLADQDEAQAALQPAMSAAASHLTSVQTPAAEKAAALERLPGAGFFDLAIAERDEDENEDEYADDNDDDEAAKPFSTQQSRRPENENKGPDGPALSLDSRAGSSRPNPSSNQLPDQLPMPSPWTSGSKSFAVKKDPLRTRPTKGFLGSAFAPTRQQRSRSAGQEALKKLSRAFPSITGPSNLLPSLPTSFLSTLTGDHRGGPRDTPKLAPAATPATATPVAYSKSKSVDEGPDKKRSAAPGTSRTAASSLLRPQPPMLRRVTSDGSMLYHSLSRQSSLGDDNKFNDVREMVNIRFMAIKDSLPDVPNFKMPSLAKLQAASRMSSISLNGFFSSSSDDNSNNNNNNNNNNNTAWRKQTAGDSAGAHANPHPHLHDLPTSYGPSPDSRSALDRVLETLTGDVVILGGYRGSVLRSAEPPHHQLWAPVKLGFNMRKANLEVGLEDEDEATMERRIIPSGMLKHIGPVDISRKLFKKLRSSPNARSGKLRVWDFGYDWRLSPASTSLKLQRFLADLPSNQTGTPPQSRGAIVIAHSLGGLITRHAVNQQPRLFAGVVYAGVPQRCINILGPLRNGDAVLFNEKLLTAQVNFSIRTSFALLPEDGFCFIDKETGESYPVDFYDADEWVRWRLSPCVAPLLPPYGREKQQSLSSPLSVLFPNSLLLKNKKPIEPDIQASGAVTSRETHHHHHQQQHGVAGDDDNVDDDDVGDAAAPLPPEPQSSSSPPPPSWHPTISATGVSSGQEQHLIYLRRVLAATKEFRSKLAHDKSHESSNAYPPHAVLYGKTIPTVHAAQVAGRDAIPHADAYDDLLFRPGDGVVLAREAMLPDGYSIVRTGRVSTERGHLTMLGDLPAVGRALEALLRGRYKGIGLGTGTARRAVTGQHASSAGVDST